MPTKLPRLNVTIDSELAHALAVARRDSELGELAEAARVRALAIRGAAALEAETPLTDLERKLLELGAALPVGDFAETVEDILSRPAPESGLDETADETLAWIRGHDRGH